jgi:anti-sigma regulatory factor (Ser/Thr protein kinase)
MAARSFELQLPRHADAPGQARRVLTQWFASNLLPSELETATLLASELVTNAVRHGEGKIKLQADLDDDRLLVEVIDEGGGLERTIRARNFENVQGWGLRIVDFQSSRWGAHEGTTHVWFELERRGPRPGPGKNPATDS